MHSWSWLCGKLSGGTTLVSIICCKTRRSRYKTETAYNAFSNHFASKVHHACWDLAAQVWWHNHLNMSVGFPRHGSKSPIDTLSASLSASARSQWLTMIKSSSILRWAGSETCECHLGNGPNHIWFWHQTLLPTAGLWVSRTSFETRENRMFVSTFQLNGHINAILIFPLEMSSLDARIKLIASICTSRKWSLDSYRRLNKVNRCLQSSAASKSKDLKHETCCGTLWVWGMLDWRPANSQWQHGPDTVRPSKNDKGLFDCNNFSKWSKTYLMPRMHENPVSTCFGRTSTTNPTYDVELDLS